MKIGIYIETTIDEQPRGVGLHTDNLVRALIDLDSTNHYYLYYPQPLTHRVPPPTYASPHGNFHLRPIRFPRNWAAAHPKLWWDSWLPLRIRRDRLDVYHCPSHFLPALRKPKLITTIHDVAYFKIDSLYPAELTAGLREWTRRSLQRADCVIALSDNTSSDLVSLGVSARRIRTIYGGGNLLPIDHIQFERLEEVRRRYGLKPGYVLYVGTLHPRKNITFLLKAFAKLRDDRRVQRQLVLVGMRESATAEVERVIEELRLTDDVVITGYAEGWEMPLIYQMANVFVLPSQYEGFGMTVVEAMAYGAPVIAADSSCLREVVGDAGLLVPVNDVSALAVSLARLLEDEAMRAEFVQRGKLQSRRFSWRQSALQTLNVYRELADSAFVTCVQPQCELALSN
jgi:glycosyltransferase involved in cell wall biosynthesis